MIPKTKGIKWYIQWRLRRIKNWILYQTLDTSKLIKIAKQSDLVVTMNQDLWNELPPYARNRMTILLTRNKKNLE